jgi:nucleotide-binding universal stress UspA family protein
MERPRPPVILVAVDGGDRTRSVLRAAADLAGRLSARLEIVHVVRRVPGLPPEVTDPTLTQDVGADLFPEIVETLADSAVGWNLHTVEGDPAQQVVRVARGVDAALIVIGAHDDRAHHLLSRRARCIVERLMRRPEVPLLVYPHDNRTTQPVSDRT